MRVIIPVSEWSLISVNDTLSFHLGDVQVVDSGSMAFTLHRLSLAIAPRAPWYGERVPLRGWRALVSWVHHSLDPHQKNGIPIPPLEGLNHGL